MQGMETSGLYNIDDKSAFTSCLNKIQEVTTRSFIVKFNSSVASCAVNVDGGTLEKCLEGSVPKYHTQWINFWGWNDTHRESIRSIAARYDVSPRLMGFLCPKVASPVQTGTTPAQNTVDSQAKPPNDTDLEKCTINIPRVPLMPTKPRRAQQMPNFKDVIADLWHFCSVDWGERYLYIGFNALFTIPGIQEDIQSNQPAGIRIWTSILLCDDGTVLSVFETPDVNPELLPAATKRVRQNVYNIFRHLSALYTASDDLESLMTITIRPQKRKEQHNEDLNQDTLAAARESASLLFYYLFDDWVTTYSLIARREHPYRDKLEDLRQEMFQKADVMLVQSLHQVGRQLTVLKLMYNSYEAVVSSLLHRQRVMRNTSQHTTFNRENTFGQNGSVVPLDQHEFGYVTPNSNDAFVSIRLSMSAIVRFERLLDRIKLYAITEIDQCLSEKQSLDFMTFNLVQLKESQSVEKLTRTTILLAKATILFLPVSLMTTYFSIQIGDIAKLYSLKTYWLCFLVVVVLSVFMLYAIGIARGTIKGKSMYTSFSRPLWYKIKNEKKNS